MSNSDVKDALQAGRDLEKAEQTVRQFSVHGVDMILPPTGRDVQTLEYLRETPTSKRGTVTVYDVGGFVAYVTRHQSAGTLVFADVQNGTIEAVLDHHTPNAPGWGRHRVKLATRPTLEWAAWEAASGQRKTQVDFAQFVEDHLTDIAEPAGSVLLRVVTALEMKKNVTFASAINLGNGQTQLTYHEDVNDATKGEMKIPTELVLGLAPFEGCDALKVAARLRYRLDNGRLVLWVDLLYLDRVWRAAFQSRVAEIEAGLSAKVLMGVAPPETTVLD